MTLYHKECNIQSLTTIVDIKHYKDKIKNKTVVLKCTSYKYICIYLKLQEHKKLLGSIFATL